MMKKIIKKLVVIILFVCFAFAAFVLACNYYVYSENKDLIMEKNQLVEIKADYIMVLGAGVLPGQIMSDMLADRMQVAVELYKSGASDKLLITGDSEDTDDYDETSVMYDYAIQNGVDEEDIFVDTVGLSTYDSIVRASNQLSGKTIIIVTQQYHLYRSIYIAKSRGLTAYGCAADLRSYKDNIYNNVRELGARTKEVYYITLNKPTTYGIERPIIF